MFSKMTGLSDWASQICEALYFLAAMRLQCMAGRDRKDDVVMLNPFGVGADESMFNTINSANTSAVRESR